VAIGTVVARPPGPHARPQQEVETVELSYFPRMADHEAFTRLALVETHRRGVETAGTVCVLGDGALWNQALIDHHRPDAVRILDWPHATSSLSPVAQALYGVETPAAGTWLARQKATPLAGEPPLVLGAVADLQVAPVASGRRERWAWTLPRPSPADPPRQGVLGQAAAGQALAVVGDSLA